MRIPTLIHHYFEHVEWDNSSLSTFLSEHYSLHINHPDDKHHDHENLPFKTIHAGVHNVVITPQPQFCLSQNVFFPTKTISLISNQLNYSNQYLNSIWQPPRFS
jgi:hypothetical protein